MKSSIALFSDAAKRASPKAKPARGGSKKPKTKKRGAPKKSKTKKPSAVKKVKSKKENPAKMQSVKKVIQVKKEKLPVLKKAASQKRKAKKVIAQAVPKPPGVCVGKIAYYFQKANACAFKVENAELKEGAAIRILGDKTDFKMNVKSIQINRIPVPSGRPGEDVGIGVTKPVCVGDSIYLI